MLVHTQLVVDNYQVRLVRGALDCNMAAAKADVLAKVSNGQTADQACGLDQQAFGERTRSTAGRSLANRNKLEVCAWLWPLHKEPTLKRLCEPG